MKLIRPLLTAALQVMLSVVIYFLLFFLFEQIGYKSSFNIAWGLSLKMGFYIFCVVILIINYVWMFDFSQRIKNFLLLFFIIFFIAFWIEDIKRTPYKTALFLFCSVIGFLSKGIIDRIIRNLSRR